MTDGSDICLGPGDDAVGNCGRPVFRTLTKFGDKPLCHGHCKQRQRGKKLSPLQKLTAWQVLVEAIELRNDAIEAFNEGYGSEAACKKADRAVQRAASRYGRSAPSSSDSIRVAFQLHAGRHPKLSAAEAVELLSQTGSIAQAARARGVCRGTIRRALKRAVGAATTRPDAGGQSA